MKINTKVRYGLRTMIEIGLQENKAGILQKDIAVNQKISEKYLDHIISALKIAGLIVNVSGKKSGYILAKPKSKIKVYDIYRALESDPAVVPCVSKHVVCDSEKACLAKDYWFGLNEVIVKYLKKTSLSDLIKSAK